MRPSFARLALPAVLATLSFAVAPFARAQTTAAVEHSARITGAVDAGQKVQLTGHVPAFADTNQLPSTAISSGANFEHLTVVLSRAPAVEAAFEQLLADQVNPSSARYHQWLTPAQVGTLYGPAQSDVDAVTGWLQSQGLMVNSVSPNRLFVDFSGPAASVETAFGTSFREFSLANGEQRYSITQEPSIPAAIQPVVSSIAGLSQALHYSTAQKGTYVAPGTAATGNVIAPDYTVTNSSGVFHYLLAGDFNNAYDIASTLTAGTTGTGQKVAIVGQSRVAATDISTLETMEGISAAGLPNVIVPPSGVDPGVSNTGAQDEATLDVTRVFGTAPGSTIDLVVSSDIGAANTYATQGLYVAINYAIATVNDPILSISFGGCEALNGSANDTYESNLFQTAAAQGITTFVSSGDSGAAACDAFYTSIPTGTQNVLSINDLCASQYVTCVGGTEFAADVTSPTTYWSSTNSSVFTSLQGYIPEGAWNDPTVNKANTYYGSGGTGGGTSMYLARPSWQTGSGVPVGSFRLVPDLAFTSSANHDGFVVCLSYANAACTYSGTTITNAAVFGGTSAAAPSMAGIQALANQKLGARQGNINPVLYNLGNAGTAFHDVTVATSGVPTCTAATPSLCNNSDPAQTSLTGGLAGYLVNTGYDEVTGWGSLDVAKYITAVTASAGFTVTPASAAITVTPGSATGTTDTLTLTSNSGFAGSVALTCAVFPVSGTPTGACAFSPNPVVLTSATNALSTLTVTAGSGTGTFNVVITAVSGGTTEYATVSVTASTNTTPTFVASSSTASLSFTSGATTGNTATVNVGSQNGFSGAVSFTCSITSSSAYYPPTCAMSPTSVNLGSNGVSSSTVIITSTKAVTASLDPSHMPFGWRTSGGAVLALLLVCVPLRKRRRALQSVALLGFLAFSFSAITGCSSGGSSTAGGGSGTGTTTRSSAGSYTVTVTATGTSSGASTSVTQTSTIAVTIN